MPSKTLEVRNLDAFYGHGHVVQQASFDVGTECVAIMGRNGAGKTTLARGILGLSPPRCEGQVLLHGEQILGLKPHAISRRGVGYVPQGRRLFPSLNVIETLQLTERRAGSDSRWNIDAIMELFPALARRTKSLSDNLSGGEKSMLAIGRALMTNPRCLVLDEPTEGLAPTVVERVAEALQALVSSGVSVLLIEQSLKAVELSASRIYLMNVGRIAGELSTAEFLGDKKLQDQYLGVVA